jgi:alpha-mannosidase
MDEFPDYQFTQSQPQLYDYVRQDYPELFEAIKTKIGEGRWEAIGGMWVEADCNISGGESLARQFFLGRNFFRQHFGDQADSPVLWLPDVFGYSWALPQLIKLAGLDYFMTIKIGWSQYNRLPYDSFWWRGIDGTSVLTHFSTTPEPSSKYASTYNAKATPENAINTWRNFQQKEHQSELLMAFGYGDGGGGPTREMLENIRDMGDFPGLPKMRHGKVGDFFTNLEANSGDVLPTWNGELYLEYHRGTYTTQARNKRANRKSEFLLHDAEFLATWASVMDENYAYPHDDLNKAWELVCLNQFHDIIPGSSINAVYVDSMQDYALVSEIGERVKNEALDILRQHFTGDLLVINPTSFERDSLVHWNGTLDADQSLIAGEGPPIYSQRDNDGIWFDVDDLMPYSILPIHFAQEPEQAHHMAVRVTERLLENDLLRIELNDAGDIIRIFDKFHERELLPNGGIANQFQAFEDRPMFWDAWDIDIYYSDKMWTSEPAHFIEIVEAGPVRATLEIKRRILNSEFTQRLSLDFFSHQIRFDTIIDWRERHTLLKVAFPLNILSPKATYDIQWGNVERPTHSNTSWDWARFETCAQKWVDLSEGNYGVSLLNDCKYGHDIRDNIIRMTLLRSPTMPDPEADQGIHKFSYVLMPHDGDFKYETIPAAYALNDPMIVTNGNPTNGSGSIRQYQFIALDHENIVIETIKRAEDGNGVIVRLYECHRERGRVILTTGFNIDSAAITNLLEVDQVEIPVNDNQIELAYTPYQIITLRIVPASN